MAKSKNALHSLHGHGQCKKINFFYTIAVNFYSSEQRRPARRGRGREPAGPGAAPSSGNRQCSLDREVYYSTEGGRREVVTYTKNNNRYKSKLASKYKMSEAEEKRYKDSMQDLCSMLKKISSTKIDTVGVPPHKRDGSERPVETPAIAPSDLERPVVEKKGTRRHIDNPDMQRPVAVGPLKKPVSTGELHKTTASSTSGAPPPPPTASSSVSTSPNPKPSTSSSYNDIALD